MAASGPDLAAQLERAASAFAKRFGRRPTVAAVAPGRVNLIGEHTDYNDGYVLPIAVERQTVVVADPAPRRRATIASEQIEEQAVFDVSSDLRRGAPDWSNYVRGVVAGCLDHDIDPGGFDMLIDSTVPVGSGLSSSAALEVATATLMEALAGRTLAALDKVLLCQQAEHTFAGMPCGIMDQYIAVMAQRDHACLLDCRSHAGEQVPLDDASVTLLVADTRVRHELVEGSYARRRAECEEAAAALGAASLRDVTPDQLEANIAQLEAPLAQRARHVVSEIARTLAAAEAMRQGRWAELGALMFASHASLRDDFEVSCRELDVLVDTARQREGDVLGARMTGGGFGGCAIILARTDAAAQVTQHLQETYLDRTGIDATIFTTRPAEGARVVRI